MNLDEKQIGRIVERVVDRLAGGVVSSPGPRATGTGSGRGIFETVEKAVPAARRAFEEFRECSLETRARVVEAMRRVTLAHNEELSRMTVQETGLGRVADKIEKNLLAATKTPGPEILTPWCQTGDDGLTIMERAAYGVIGAITPCTNATETIVNNGISMLSAGNAVVFNVHPAARGVCNYHVGLLNQAVEGAGGPANLMCSIHEPTIQSAGTLMTHPGVRLLTVTGGGGVVKAAMNSGKRAIAAGPGNPPVLVDETCDLNQAADGVIAGASLDNNIVCIAEKVLIAVADIADALKREMKKRNVVELSSGDIRRLEKVLITSDNHINRDFIGKNPSVILNEIGIRVGDEVRLVLCEVDEKHPFVQLEQLMPVLPMVRVPNVDDGIECARRVEHGYGHTAVMYSRDIEKLHKMARIMDVSIYVKNAPSTAGIGGGGEGYTSFTIASPTGEGLTTAISFSRQRRCTLKEYFRIV
jgi:acyl-CoA reductase-like NAD-dependent aldehyde dehydrogenase